MNRILIETTIKRALKDMADSPKRSARNLVDLGVNFSNGRFQKQFLRSTQDMLHNEKSSYYELIENVITNVNYENLTTFGINLGYEGCTKGAKTIRAIEEKRGFNIPWSLSLYMNEEKLDTTPQFYTSVVEQGVALGIHTYLLFLATGSPARMIPLIKSHSNCAFILFLRKYQLSDSFLESLKGVTNIMISILADCDITNTCNSLRAAKLLFAVHKRYQEEDKENILNGNWLSKVLKEKPYFAFLLAHESCSFKLQQEIYSYILSVRNKQKHPVILMDARQDNLIIDQIISGDECIVGFDADGSLRTLEGINPKKEYNIFYNKLEDILQSATKK